MESFVQSYSVLMSVYKKEKPEFLQESFESMFNQTVPTDDFILVCDGELTDGLDFIIAMYVNRYPGVIHVVRLPENRGLGEALAAGLLLCKNELVARMDSDDIAFMDRCEKQLKVFEENEVDIVGGTIVEFIDSIDNPVSKRQLPKRQDQLLRFAKKRNPFNHPSVMFKKSIVTSAGSFQRFPLFEDYHLWLRILINGGTGYNIQEPILYMRVGAGMYARRGGLGYWKNILKFEKYKRSIGLTNIFEALSNIVIRGLISVFPNTWRQWVYKTMLRRKV